MRKDMRLLKILILISALVFISACVGKGGMGAVGAGGVRINSFAFSPTKVFAGGKTLLNLNVENTGDMDAKDVMIFLYGLGSDWKEDGKAVDTTKEIGLLERPQAAMNIPGGQETVSWILIAPRELPQTTVSFTAGVRVCYPYKTTAKARAEILSEDEYLYRQQQGTLREHPIEMRVSASPVGISIVSPQPLLVSGDRNMILKMTITNNGGGWAASLPCETFKKGLTPEQIPALNNISLEIGGVDITCSVTETQIWLERGSTQSLVAFCPIGETQMAVPERTRDIEIEIDYTYYLDTQASITVEGFAAPGVPEYAPPVERAPEVKEEALKPEEKEKIPEEAVVPTATANISLYLFGSLDYYTRWVKGEVDPIESTRFNDVGLGEEKSLSVSQVGTMKAKIIAIEEKKATFAVYCDDAYKGKKFTGIPGNSAIKCDDVEYFGVEVHSAQGTGAIEFEEPVPSVCTKGEFKCENNILYMCIQATPDEEPKWYKTYDCTEGGKTCDVTKKTCV